MAIPFAWEVGPIGPDTLGPPLGYDPTMSNQEPGPSDDATQAELAAREDEALAEYDVWRWHIEGKFPKDQPPEQGYVHIGMYVAWLITHDMLAPDWIAGAGAGDAIRAVADRRETPCALREISDGRLAGEMLTTEGRAFTSAYYAPEYGYARDWRKTFGRLADRYEVPDGWATFDRIEPLLEWQFEGWVDAGRPELMPVPGLVGTISRFIGSRIR
jgi:hypothetical protein